MPVFNRLEYTKKALNCIQNQLINEELCTIIIDDGSTDGTSEYLFKECGLNVLKGDGSLWWGGSIEVGLQYVLSEASNDDWILLLNNDTEFDSDFIRSLHETALSFKPAAVGSVICDINQPNNVISIGPKIDPWRLKIDDILNYNLSRHSNHYFVDALSGRGTLYPLSVFKECGTMRPALLPHYFADYELSLRAKKCGYKLVVSAKARTLSIDEYGNSTYFPLRTRFTSKKSSLFIPAVLSFWFTASINSFQTITLLPRFLFKSLYSILKGS